MEKSRTSASNSLAEMLQPKNKYEILIKSNRFKVIRQH